MVCLLVVYHLVPTSNHNSALGAGQQGVLFIILFLHQTTTRYREYRIYRGCLSSCSYIKPQPTKLLSSQFPRCLSSCSYIKPQPFYIQRGVNARCLSSCSYIKPQQKRIGRAGASVVYHLVPTSNHNHKRIIIRFRGVVYHLVPTSNHNIRVSSSRANRVVYHLVPTSNHNNGCKCSNKYSLFIILFLHQTTTELLLLRDTFRCLSSCSYIKPQP